MSQLVESPGVTYSADSLFFELGWLPIGSSDSTLNVSVRSIAGLIGGFDGECRRGRFFATSAHVFGEKIREYENRCGVDCLHKKQPKEPSQSQGGDLFR